MLLTFLTYNILDGGVGRENELFEIIAAQNADVILLQEVVGTGFVEESAERCHLNFYIAEGNSGRAVALLTGLPIEAAATFRPSFLRHTVLHATLEDAPQQRISVFGLHLAAPAFTLWVEWYRLRELNLILDHIAEVGGDNIVVAGDFNSIAPGDTPNFRTLPISLRLSVLIQGGYFARQVIGKMRARGFTDVYRGVHPKGSGYTLPAAHADTRLDYFFVNDALRGTLRGSDVVASPDSVRLASDHLPIRMELEMQ